MPGRYVVMFSVTVDSADPLEAYEEARQRVGVERVNATVWTLPDDIDSDPVMYSVTDGGVSE